MTIDRVNPPRVYLAGPEVFLRDATRQGEKKKALCAAHGLEGVFPLDVELAAQSRPRREAGMIISQANEALMKSCVAVIANMTPFRGISADVGTAYEMGFGRALGLAVFAYTTEPRTFIERTVCALGASADREEHGVLRDAHGMEVENWDIMDNLMLEGGVYASGGGLVVEPSPPGQEFTHLAGFENCVRRAASFLLADSERNRTQT
jgi:nucleoside 2-deoxyribosyltransferase